MNKQKIGASLLLLNGIIYLTTEFITALATNYSLKDVYLKHFISSLGVYPDLNVADVPPNFSPLSWLMNFGFIYTGIGFAVSYLLIFYNYIKTKTIFTKFFYLLLPLTFMFGSILVGFYQGGVPSEDGLHGLGARLSFLFGNSTLIFTGIIMLKQFKKYSLLAIFLGIFGICAAFGMQNAINENHKMTMVVFERLTVYPITLWQLITGLKFLKINKELAS